MANAVAIEDVFALASQLPPVDKARLIARLADELAASAPPKIVKPLIGLVADLGPAPSAQDIDESRRDMLGGSR
jgi:hypothetical protein